MKFDYVMKRNDLKKIIFNNYKSINLVYFVIGFILFIALTYKIATYNFWFFLLALIIYLGVLGLVLYLMDTLFTNLMLKYNDSVTKEAYGTFKVDITKNSIKETVNKQSFEMTKEEIKKIKITKNSIHVFNGTKIGFLFYKNLFKKESDFDKVVDYLKVNYLDQK